MTIGSNTRVAWLLAGLAALQGCSASAWYSGIQESRRIECRHLPAALLAECLDEVNTSYDEYQRRRQAVAEAN